MKSQLETATFKVAIPYKFIKKNIRDGMDYILNHRVQNALEGTLRRDWFISPEIII